MEKESRTNVSTQAIFQKTRSSHQKMHDTSQSDAGLLSSRSHPGLFLCIILVSSFFLTFVLVCHGAQEYHQGFAEYQVAFGRRSLSRVRNRHRGPFVKEYQFLCFYLSLYSSCLVSTVCHDCISNIATVSVAVLVCVAKHRFKICRHYLFLRQSFLDMSTDNITERELRGISRSRTTR